jgi:hypothetical protein
MNDSAFEPFWIAMNFSDVCDPKYDLVGEYVINQKEAQVQNFKIF